MDTTIPDLPEATEAASPPPALLVEDGQIIILAVLSLAGLKNFDLAAFHAGNAEEEFNASLVDAAIGNVITTFKYGWTHKSEVERIRELDELKRLTGLQEQYWGHYMITMAMSYFEAIDAFHRMVLNKTENDDVEALTPEVLVQSIFTALEEDVFEANLPLFLDEHEEIMARNVVAERSNALGRLVEVFTKRFLSSMLHFVRITDPNPSKALRDTIYFGHRQMMGECLEEHIYRALEKLSAKLVVPEPPEQKIEHVKAFIGTIIMFFTYASPLLMTEEDDRNEAEMLSGWYGHEPGIDPNTGEQWEEFEPLPAELEDVLTGPETVSIDEVSIPHQDLDSDTAECGICGQQGGEMRMLDVCQHVFCKNCLSGQLQARGNYRYRCAICRAYIIPAELTASDQETE